MKKFEKDIILFMERYPNRIKMVNADQPLEQVVNDVWDILAKVVIEKK